MTPAITVARKNNICHVIHEYSHDPASDSYGNEAAEKLGISATQVFKTLVVMLDQMELAIGVVPVSSTLNMKNIARAANAKKATMAPGTEVERATGYVLGGVSPLGQKKKLRTIIDSSAKVYSSIYVSAGRRGLEIELNPDDLIALTQGIYAEISKP